MEDKTSSGSKDKRQDLLGWKSAVTVEFETWGFQEGMYNEAASRLPDKAKRKGAVNTGVKLLIRNLECIERKALLSPGIRLLSVLAREKKSKTKKHLSKPRIWAKKCLYSFKCQFMNKVWLWTEPGDGRAAARNSTCIHQTYCWSSCYGCWCCSLFFQSQDY